MALGTIAASHADENEPYAIVSLSNYRPNSGDPIAVYLDLYDCVSFPANISARLTNPTMGGFVPFATLSKSSSSYKWKKNGSVFRVQWLYRGPTGDGIGNQDVVVFPDATGGCVTDPEVFREDSEPAWWYPKTSGLAGININSLLVLPELNGVSMSWTHNGAVDESNFFEIQYAAAGTNEWSRSFVTKDSKYNLLGLSKGTIYDVRIRGGNKNGVGEWLLSYQDTSLRTPASFVVSSMKTDGTPTRTFATGDTVRVEMKLNECSIQPQSNGAITYILFASDRTQTQFPPRVAFADSQGFTYDGVLQKYEGSLDFSDLPDGSYEMQPYLTGNCGWTYGPVSLGGSPYGNRLEFTVGPRVPQLPRWTGNPGEITFVDNFEVTAQTSTSATLTWSRPKNTEDGPFTYTVEMIKPDNTVIKILGTTKNHSFTVGGLKAGTRYEFQVLASNSATTLPSMRPYSTIEMATSNLTVKRGGKLTAVAYAKAIGTVVPSGATVTIAKPKGTFLFSDCTFAKNVVTFKNSVGACSVQLTIKPKKVGNKQPKSIVSLHDVMIKK
jgi:hypothetical protein